MNLKEPYWINMNTLLTRYLVESKPLKEKIIKEGISPNYFKRLENKIITAGILSPTSKERKLSLQYKNGGSINDVLHEVSCLCIDEIPYGVSLEQALPHHNFVDHHIASSMFIEPSRLFLAYTPPKFK